MPMIDSAGVDMLTRFLDVNAYRHTLITSNLANIDTPGNPVVLTFARLCATRSRLSTRARNPAHAA